MLTADRLRDLLDYNSETGIFRWKVRVARRVRVGDIAGSADNGYREIRIDYTAYRAHRLAWLYAHGVWPKEIDHINGVMDDNRLLNLRDATKSENQQNQRRAQSNNKTGLLGVSLRRGKFQAQIMASGKNLHLGYFATAELAHAAYVQAKRRLHPAGML